MKNSTQAINALIADIEKHHYVADQKNMMDAVKQLQVLSEKSQNELGLTAASFYLGTYYYDIGKHTICKSYFEKSLKIAQARSFPYYEMRSYSGLAVTYLAKSDFLLSLTKYMEASRISTAHPEYQYESTMLNNIGNLFVWLDDYDTAARLLERAYKQYFVEEQENTPLLMILIINNMEANCCLERYDRMDEWRACIPVPMSKDHEMITNCIQLTKNAAIHYQDKDYNSMKQKIDQMLEISTNSVDYIYIFRCLLKMLTFCVHLGEMEIATRLVTRMDEMNASSEITAFDYAYADIKLQYRLALSAVIDTASDPYLGHYYQQSKQRNQQLKKAYSRCLLIEIDLDRIRSENSSIANRCEQLKIDAETDVCSGILNKMSAERYIAERMLANSGETSQVLLACDIDLFKVINDTYGHAFGDKVIVEIASALSVIKSEHNIVGRIGGDEFLLFLENVEGIAQVTQMATELMERVHAIELPDQQLDKITLSIGICWTQKKISFANAFAIADKALYAAKRQGRDRYVLGGKQHRLLKQCGAKFIVRQQLLFSRYTGKIFPSPYSLIQKRRNTMQPLTHPIRWAILSTGTIAKNFAVVASKLNAGHAAEINIAAVASRNEASARAFADVYHIPKAYASYEELAADPDIDIVYVATPHSRHFEDMRLLLSSGKHILCEKSFTVDSKEAREIYTLAQEKNLLVIEAFWTKFLPIYREVERRLTSGIIGDVKLVTAQYGYTTAREQRKFDPALAGGALLDIGVYCIGFAAMVLGYQPDSIHADICLNAVGTDAFDSISLRYANATAVLNASIGVNVPTLGVIYGSKGRIELPDFKNPQAFEQILDDGTHERFELPFEVNGYEYQMREAQECLLAGKAQSELMTPEQSIAVMKIMDEVRTQGGLRFPFEK